MNLDEVAAALLPQERPRDVHAYGRVAGVNEDGSYEVRLNASSVTTRCAACCTASAGDRVLVVIKADGKCAAVGRVGGLVSPSELDELEELLGISSGGGCSMTDLMWDMAHPVGSVLQAACGFDPNTVRGTWEKIEGVFLLASSSGHPAGETGGEEKHTLTVAEMPKNYASFTVRNVHDLSSVVGVTNASSSQTVRTDYTPANLSSLTGSATTVTLTGSGSAHNNMPPYLAVDTWRRVA